MAIDCTRDCVTCLGVCLRDVPPPPCLGDSPAPCLRDVPPPPCLGDSPMPPLSLTAVYIYSNDGSTLIGTVMEQPVQDPFTTTGYRTIYPYLFNTDQYNLQIACNFYGGPYPDTEVDLSEYKGISDSPYASEPDEKYLTSYSFPEGIESTVYVVNNTPIPPIGSTLDVVYNSIKIIDSLEVIPPIAVTYNNSTIATLNEGDTKTLQCNSKVMANNIMIGDKILQCSGKLMASDLIVTVSGKTPWEDPTQDDEVLSITQVYGATQSSNILVLE